MSSHYLFGETLNGACAIESLILFSGELDPAAVRPLFQSIEEEGRFSLEDGRARIAGHRPQSEARIFRSGVVLGAGNLSIQGQSLPPIVLAHDTEGACCKAL